METEWTACERNVRNLDKVRKFVYFRDAVTKSGISPYAGAFGVHACTGQACVDHGVPARAQLLNSLARDLGHMALLRALKAAHLQARQVRDARWMRWQGSASGKAFYRRFAESDWATPKEAVCGRGQ